MDEFRASDDLLPQRLEIAQSARRAEEPAPRRSLRIVHELLDATLAQENSHAELPEPLSQPSPAYAEPGHTAVKSGID